MFVLFLCVFRVLAQDEDDCSEFKCRGCINPEVVAGCSWCGSPESGQCIKATDICQNGNMGTDPSVCSTAPASTAPAAAGAVPCKMVAMDQCARDCGGRVATCICETDPSIATVTCEKGLGGGLIAVIVVGGLLFVALVVGMVVFLVKSRGDDGIVVVDKKGRKVRRKTGMVVDPVSGRLVMAPPVQNSARAPNGAVQQNASLAQVAQGLGGNPGPDGLWYCAAEGDPTCNRAYYTQHELHQHIGKRHPHVQLTQAGAMGGTIAGGVGVGAGFPDPGLSVRDPAPGPMLQHANTVASGLGGGEQIFKCPQPGCPKGYWTQSDLDQHMSFRHGSAPQFGTPNAWGSVSGVF